MDEKVRICLKNEEGLLLLVVLELELELMAVVDAR
jgi:hypothetical protein